MAPKFGAVAYLLAILQLEDEWIFIKFQDRSAMTQEKIWIIWGDVGFNSLGSFVFLLSGSVFSSQVDHQK